MILDIHVVGILSLGATEKGEQLFASFAAGTADFLKRVIEWDGTSWDG